jgi:hypothetical protein
MSIDSSSFAYARPQARQPEWRLIPQIDRDPKIVAGVQGDRGRLALAAAVVVLIILLSFVGISFSAGLLALACAYAGRYHRHAIALGTLLLLYRNGFFFDTPLLERLAAQQGYPSWISEPLLRSAMLISAVGLFSCLLMLRRRASWVLSHPTLVLLVSFLGLLATTQEPVTAGVPRLLIWSLLMTVQPYLWFLIYALAEVGKDDTPVWQHFSVFHPLWGSTLTPFGKGLSYLRRFEAKTPEELAVTQLKGLKLAAWTLLLAVALNGFTEIVHDRFGLPNFDDALIRHIDGNPASRWVCWVSLIAYFVEDLLSMSIFGGIIVSGARLAGFRLLRNTYRPLEATTLAEFWNRYYFYFKELLVDHFFYPTFVRCFRNHRRLRLFFATFTAACVGNLLFHFVRDVHFVGEMGLWNAVVGEQSHAFFTFVVATSVGVSQLRRAPKPDGGNWFRARLLPFIWVCAFFCILHIFDAPLDREHSLWQRGGFLLYLLGLNT